MDLMKMRLLIFLVFNKYELDCKYENISKYQYIIGCRIAFSDTCCNNCQSGKAITETRCLKFMFVCSFFP